MSIRLVREGLNQLTGLENSGLGVNICRQSFSWYAYQPCFAVYLPTEMEAAVSTPAKPHPVSADAAAHIWTFLIPQHYRTVER